MTNDQHNPLILGFVADLYFAVRIEKAANQLNFDVRWIENADQIALKSPELPDEQLAEPLVGRSAVLIDELTTWKPTLMIFDLNNQDIPWREWISLVTSVPATRRIPVLCFGSHREVEVMKDAKTAGAKIVLARSTFVSRLPELIKKYAMVIDQKALNQSCREPLPDLAIQGLEEFNRTNYFEAHEYLEEAWRIDQSIGRDLYQAVLQVAVAYYHIMRGNYKGAAKLFLRVRQWIDPLPDICRGVDIKKLRMEARIAHQELLNLGPERIKEFDLSLLRPVHYKVPGDNEEFGEKY